MNSDLSYPVITQHCPDPVLGAEMNLLMDGNLQTGLTLSYPSFFFVANEDGPNARVKLSCSVSIKFFFAFSKHYSKVVTCDANDEGSDCALGCQPAA